MKVTVFIIITQRPDTKRPLPVFPVLLWTGDSRGDFIATTTYYPRHLRHETFSTFAAWSIIYLMNYWLVKSEPSKYSWEQFVRDGKTFWDGVRNYGARNNLRAMKTGDRVFFYHSNEGLAIVGIAEVVKAAYQDPTTTDPAWVAVDLKPIKTLPREVTLAEIKAEPMLQDMDLVRLSRLSVGAVKPAEYKKVLVMGGVKGSM